MTSQHDLIMQNVSQLYNPKNAPLDILYIGAHHKEFLMAYSLVETGHSLTLLELNEQFAKRYTLEKYEHELFDNIIVGDVRNLDPTALKVLRGAWPSPPLFNVVIWWHGPEHIHRHEVNPTIASLERITKRLVVLACPWGKTHMDRKVDNGKIPGQVHLSQLYPEDFEILGYQTATIGFADGRIADPRHATHLFAWKWLK